MQINPDGFWRPFTGCRPDVSEENISPLREKLNALAEKHFESTPAADVLYVDAVAEPEEITPDLTRDLALLEPLALEIRNHALLGKNGSLKGKKEVGKRLQHLQLSLKNDLNYSGISFNGKSRLPEMDPFREIDFVFNISFDRWREMMHYSWKYFIFLIVMNSPGKTVDR